jgi:hypothetical protein
MKPLFIVVCYYLLITFLLNYNYFLFLDAVCSLICEIVYVLPNQFTSFFTSLLIFGFLS